MSPTVRELLRQSTYQELAERVCHDGNFGTPIAAGNDSFVRQVEDLVFKKYTGENLIFMTGGNIKPKIDLYAQVMIQAGLLSEKENWQFKLPYSHQSFPLRVNPILAVVTCRKCNSVTGISPFISGKKVEDDTSMFDPKELGIALMTTGDWIGKRLAVQGIDLKGNNLKGINGIGESGDYQLMATDLAAMIALIKRI